ncbi:MAG: response regulator [Alphaproteobacteria bacterium]|nr:response regulator [Alphaproteobacteria bacterium]
MTRPSAKTLIAKHIPYLRRYARALAGTQAAGDSLVADALRSLGEPPSNEDELRVALFKAVSSGANTVFVPHSAAGSNALSLAERQILLLTSLESFPVDAAAEVLGLPGSEAVQLLTTAKERLRANAQTDVLIIEDEPVIALDIAELVASCGHRVVGVAAAEREAIALARDKRPGLILADINLASGGDGQHAVAEIQKQGSVPVIFITAYPERLLTGALNEPTFLITKPFDPLRLAITTYQAVSGGLPFK